MAIKIACVKSFEVLTNFQQLRVLNGRGCKKGTFVPSFMSDEQTSKMIRQNVEALTQTGVNPINVDLNVFFNEYFLLVSPHLLHFV
jgi:hypothetical protein